MGGVEFIIPFAHNFGTLKCDIVCIAPSASLIAAVPKVMLVFWSELNWAISMFQPNPGDQPCLFFQILQNHAHWVKMDGQ